MNTDDTIEEITKWNIGEFLTQPNPMRSILLLIFSVLIAYWLSKFVAQFIIAIAQRVAVRSDSESDVLKALKLRQVETYLGVTVAIVRVIVVIVVAYITWRLISPEGSRQLGGSGAAAIGASAVFIVIAGQTVGILLRDVTAGTTMIAENWFKVGDHVKVEPFWDLSGVVERLTLRSTRIRKISGEVVWIHNQQISAVHVTPNGVRTLAVSILVNDKDAGEKLVKNVISRLPTGPMMLARPLKIRAVEEWGDQLWHISVDGKTVPGREWLIENYFVNALKKANGKISGKNTIITDEPIVHYDDPETSKRFRRAVRVAQKEKVA
jgi:small-conductance mechanosensitive channel